MVTIKDVQNKQRELRKRLAGIETAVAEELVKRHVAPHGGVEAGALRLTLDGDINAIQAKLRDNDEKLGREADPNISAGLIVGSLVESERLIVALRSRAAVADILEKAGLTF